jgi:hypothetical protein
MTEQIEKMENQMDNIKFGNVVDGVVAVKGVTITQVEQVDQDVLGYLYSQKTALDGCRYFSVDGKSFAVVKARGQDGVYVTREPRSERRSEGRDRSISSAVAVIQKARHVAVAKLQDRRSELLQEQEEISKCIKDIDAELLKLIAVTEEADKPVEELQQESEAEAV